MRRSVSARIVSLAAAAVLLASCTAAGGTSDSGDPATASPVANTSCSAASEQPLSQEMTSGATWNMCWSVDPALGMILSDISFTPPGADPIPVVTQMSLAQLEVPYDDGKRNTSDITTAGFGGPNMHSLTETECVGQLHSAAIPNIGDGSKYGTSPERPVLCSDVVDAGLSYRSAEAGDLLAKRKNDWQLSTVSKVGWYEYINQVTFGADGSIRPSLGATGDLSPANYSDEQHGSAVGEGDSDHASSHSHNAVWKIDWALGGEAGQVAQQFDAKDTGKKGPQSPIIEGTYTDITAPATARWTDRRWWKVMAPGTLNADGHPISYQIELGKTDSFTFCDDEDHHEGDIGYDVAFTNVDECQIFATYNSGDCGRGVVDFVAKQESQQLDDVVSWVAVGYHHVPRDEEQSPMEVHWQGFTLLPRDLTATRIDSPEERQDLNGRPENWGGEPVPESP
ncbi:copper amine oxidase [Glutamicibacter sp. AOP12-B1-11]|uniref:copper amine oxidase n=1 Tax=Glutamicibacter sp. AOP12-B1-11 TaxID=3457725 RepID=UPI004034F2D3